MLVQLILLEDLDTARRRLVLNGIKHLGRIDIGAVNVNLPYLVGRMVAMGGTQFTDGIAAIGNLGEHHRAVRLGGSLLNLGVFGVEQAEDRAR